MHYFRIFFRKFNKPCVKFSRVWTKNKLMENFEKFSKIFNFFLQKISKNPLFELIFPRYLTNHALIFRAFGRKLPRDILDILRKIWKFLMKIQQKSCIFIYFWVKLLLKIEFSEIASFFYTTFCCVFPFLCGRHCNFHFRFHSCNG